ncbi:MAG: bifunctional demethylmenaquinone methyltransferase/2-methoxy-6-polyprenyl-1,4-benzoquinol methylase UbiE [Salaquimonas sp.]
MSDNRQTSRSSSPDELAGSFGFRKINDGEKQPLVDDVFHKVAERYDLMNDLMSGGMHRLWKSALVNSLAPPKKEGSNWHSLDVAGGTGDVAFGIVEASNRTVHTTVLDINGSMLKVGAQRAEKLGLTDYVDFVEADAQKLPFEAGSFDAYTIATGIRNVPHIDQALCEAFRVLKRGGRFLCLEFSEVDMPVLDKLYDEWSMKVIPPLGKMVTGDAEPYQYLVESIRKFPSQQRFAEMIATAGFSRVDWTNYTGGIATIHSGWKL